MEYTTEQLISHIRNVFQGVFPEAGVKVAFDDLAETYIVNLHNLTNGIASYEFLVGSDDDEMVFNLACFARWDGIPLQMFVTFPEDKPKVHLGEDENGVPVYVPEEYWQVGKGLQFGTVEAMRHAMTVLEGRTSKEDVMAYGVFGFILAQSGMKAGDGEVIHFESDYLTRCVDIWVFG